MLGSPPVPTGAGDQRATVRRLHGVAEFEDAVRVLCQVWNADTALDLVNSSVMVALDMSDNYVAGVFLGNEMVGAAVGWRGAGGRVHSHIAGIHPKHQGTGLGYRLKMHEKDWALSRDLTVVEWTFDPLVRRNAHFNLAKLNTRALAYHADLYGSLEDGVNDHDVTDRLLVEWDLRADETPALSKDYGASDTESWDFDAQPDATIIHGEDRLVVTPRDIESMRLHDAPRAARWRHAVRRGLESALGDGYVITGFSEDGCYVLQRP